VAPAVLVVSATAGRPVAHLGARMAAAAALAVLSLACRSTPDEEPVRIDVGSGSPEAIARRGATEIADAGILAARAPRAGPRDSRYVVRFDQHQPAGTATLRSFRSLFERELVGCGRFLIAQDDDLPSVVARTSGPSGGEEARIQVLSPDGALWIEVLGHLVP
jgi:hypothetical protein